MAPSLRFPRPRSLLHLISLRTATEFIAFTLAINKVTGLYGILALFTGYTLNPLQLSHYIYSLAILALTIYLSPAIRTRPDSADTVLKVIALAWIYIIDAAVNSLYTTLFGLGWFVVLSQHVSDNVPAGASGPGSGTMNDTAGFTDPEHPVGEVNVVASPASGALTGQQAVAYGSGASGIGSAVFEKDSLGAMTVLGALWVIRVYLCLIVLSFARSTLRHYIATSSTAAGTTYPAQSDDATMAENPFAQGRAEGEGWKGTVARTMLRFPTKRYWLGRDESEEEWVRATSGRFESGRSLKLKLPNENGVGERERRARSGTGPPKPVGLGKVPVQ